MAAVKNTPTPDAPEATPEATTPSNGYAPTVDEAPSARQGRPLMTLPDDVLNAFGEALKNVTEGKVVTTGKTYEKRATARRDVDFVKREIIRAGGVPSKDHIGGRVWETADGKWKAGLFLKDVTE